MTTTEGTPGSAWVASNSFGARCPLVSSEEAAGTTSWSSLLIVREGEDGHPPLTLNLQSGLDLVIWKVAGIDLQPAALKGDHLAEQLLGYLPNVLRRHPLRLRETDAEVSFGGAVHRLRHTSLRDKGWLTAIFSLGGMLTLKVMIPRSGGRGRDPRRPGLNVQFSVPRFRLYRRGDLRWCEKGMNTLQLQEAHSHLDEPDDADLLPLVHSWLMTILPGVLERMGVTRRRVMGSEGPVFHLQLFQKPEVYVDATVRTGPRSTLAALEDRIRVVQWVMGQGVDPQIRRYGDATYSVAELLGGYRVKAYRKVDGRVLRVEVTGTLDPGSRMAKSTASMDYSPVVEYARYVGDGLLGVLGDALSEPLTEGQIAILSETYHECSSREALASGVRLVSEDLEALRLQPIVDAGLVHANPAPRSGYRLSRRAVAYLRTLSQKTDASWDVDAHSDSLR